MLSLSRSAENNMVIYVKFLTKITVSVELWTEVQWGHGERLLISAKEMLANHPAQKRRVASPIHTVYSAGGDLLTSTECIIGRWKESFEHLNFTNMHSLGEAEPWTWRWAHQWVAEVATLQQRSPGGEERHPKFLKADDVGCELHRQWLWSSSFPL